MPFPLIIDLVFASHHAVDGLDVVVSSYCFLPSRKPAYSMAKFPCTKYNRQWSREYVIVPSHNLCLE